MPKRPRQHQLEDTSIRFLQTLLPASWICRPNEKDYGADLSIEIFNEDGTDTGLTFLAQLKATDDQKLEKKLRIRVETLSYLAKHDMPSMVIRYCHPTKTMYYEWVTNVFSELTDPKNETVTVSFPERSSWNDGTSDEILRALKVYRCLKNPQANTPVGLSVRDIGNSADQVFLIRQVVSELRCKLGILTVETDPQKCLPITISTDGEGICASVDVITSVAGPFPQHTIPEVKSEILYSAAIICGRFGFFNQFDEIVRVILEEKFLTFSRQVASRISIYALGKPEIASEIAAMNGLHCIQDQESFYYLYNLQMAASAKKSYAGAVERYLRDSIDAHQYIPAKEQANLYYNLANFLSGNRRHLEAFREFNRARKRGPFYLDRCYFLRELAACLFFLRRYKLSSTLYQKALSLEPNSKIAICAGDALLYSGSFEDAERVYRQSQDLAGKEGDTFNSNEGWLKERLANLASQYATAANIIGTQWLSSRPFWMKLIENAQAANDDETALAAALMEGFLADADENLWADAIAFAFNCQDNELLFAVLSCAIWRFGYSVYAKFRANLRNANVPSDLVFALDEIIEKLEQEKESCERRGFTARLADGKALEPTYDC